MNHVQKSGGLPSALGEHAEGVCVSARKFVDYVDDVAERLELATEWIGDGATEDALSVLAHLTRDLRWDGALIAQFVASFDRRKNGRAIAEASASDRH